MSPADATPSRPDAASPDTRPPPPPPPGLHAAPDTASRWRGPLGWLLNDLGLKVLALALAVMMWTLVRSQVETRESVDGVTVEVRNIPDDVVLEGGNQRRVTVGLYGPAGDVERVKAELVKTAVPLVYRMDALDGDRGETGSVSDPRKFSYAVEGAAEVVTSLNPPLRLRWYRVKEVQVPVTEPELALVPGRADVELLPGSLRIDEPRTVRVRGPIEVVEALERSGQSIQPDRVDAARWLTQDLDPATAFPWESGFSRWRGRDPLKGHDLLTIEPAQVKGTLRLRFVKTEPLENTLVVLFPPGTTRDDYEAWTWEVGGTGGSYDAQRRTIRASLNAEQRVIDDLRGKDATKWCFAVTLPRPPDAGAKPPQNERTPVVFVWLRQDPAPAVRVEGAPTVFLTLRPKENGGG